MHTLTYLLRNYKKKQAHTRMQFLLRILLFCCGRAVLATCYFNFFYACQHFLLFLLACLLLYSPHVACCMRHDAVAVAHFRGFHEYKLKRHPCKGKCLHVCILEVANVIKSPLNNVYVPHITAAVHSNKRRHKCMYVRAYILVQLQRGHLQAIMHVRILRYIHICLVVCVSLCSTVFVRALYVGSLCWGTH